MADLPNIVLVQGAWIDASSWSAVIRRLQQSGYHVTAPPFPLTSLGNDVARLRLVLALQDGPTIVAAHSYGGQVATALGAEAPNVVGVVYTAAYALDEGESIVSLLASAGSGGAPGGFVIDGEGSAWIPEDIYLTQYAADVDPDVAKVMYALQQPLSATAFEQVMGTPVWRRSPTWYAVSKNDRSALNPVLQRQQAERIGAQTIDVDAGHFALISHPDAIANLIDSAARSASTS
jgi:pimeloyl-ACP methyl ester carboxylesterase